MARMLYLRDIEVDVHVRCRACGHEGVLPRADMNRRFGPNYPVLSIAPHYRCSRCNSRDTESRPAPPPYAPSIAAMGAAMGAAEEAPSFAGPLAALQGLLDAVRTRDEPDEEPEAETAPAPIPAAARTDTFALDLELERLVADGGSAPESGRPPLWEPVSLADLAGHDEDEDGTGHRDADETDWDDEEWAPRNWDLADRDEDENKDQGSADAPDQDEDSAPPPVPVARESRPALDEPDDASRSFDRTIAALRSILDGRGDGAHTEDAPPPAPPPPPSPAFSIEDAHNDPEDDVPEADDPDDTDPDDAEPSTDDILAFAIRDPDKAPPPWERDPAPTGSEPLDRTIAALRSMVQKAAADRDEDVAGRQEDERLDDDSADNDAPDGQEGEDWKAGTGEPSWGRDETEADEAEKDGTPGIRKSAQEQEMEEALRALRALVEAEGDLDDPPPPRPAWRNDAPARPDADPLPGFKPLARREPEPDDDAEPLDLVEMLPVSEPEKPRHGGSKGAEAEESGQKTAKDDASALGKTLAALRNMLELDGKQGR